MNIYCKTCTRLIVTWSVERETIKVATPDREFDVTIPREPNWDPEVRWSFVVDGHRLDALAEPAPKDSPRPLDVTVTQVTCPADGSIGTSPVLGEALRSILDDEPRLTGLVTLARSRTEWYVATTWSAAVTGPSPIVVANQAFAQKALVGGRYGSHFLPLLARIRRYETTQIERREDGLVRVTVRTTERGLSAWSSEFAPGGGPLDADLLEDVLVCLLDKLYPPMTELEHVRGAMKQISEYGRVDAYVGQLVNFWVYRWLHRRRALGVVATGRLAAELAEVLQVEEPVALAMVCPRRPQAYPCGCSRAKVDLGKCDAYAPGEAP